MCTEWKEGRLAAATHTSGGTLRIYPKNKRIRHIEIKLPNSSVHQRRVGMPPYTLYGHVVSPKSAGSADVNVKYMASLTTGFYALQMWSTNTFIYI